MLNKKVLKTSTILIFCRFQHLEQIKEGFTPLPMHLLFCNLCLRLCQNKNGEPDNNLELKDIKNQKLKIWHHN